MMASTKTRIGIIGAGAIIRERQLPNLQKIQDAEVVVICNRSTGSAAAVAKAFNVAEVAEHWEDVVRRPDLDVIWIGTTPQSHAPLSIAALAAGKHVFCQARMAPGLSDAAAMLTAARAHGNLVNMLCPPPNGMKHGRFFEELLKQGVIGKLFHFRFRSLNSAWADPAAPAHWRQRREISGNNIMSLGIYGEVLGRFFGDPAEICAQGRVCIPVRQGYEVTIPDSLQLIARWPDGLTAALEWSGVAQQGGGDKLEVFGSDGTLTYDFTTDEIAMSQNGDAALSPVPVPPAFVQNWSVEADFVEAVRHGGRPQPDFETGLRYMKWVEAATRSMESRAWVALAEL